ncbi:MAG: dimethyl sulfoxide reductase anchor subunit [Rhizobiales bacterium]|nr:dimethyl sulfoxide reductase anchor subunit [Hyphomicrobiales bacterium]
MHPAYSVILFTVASGAGYGLLALLGLVGVNHGQASSYAFALTALLIALALITTGLLSSTFHLGRPERFWRAFSQWRSSWLSREGIAAVLTYPVTLAFGAVWSGLIDAPKLIAPLGIVTAIMCAITVFFTGKIYSSLKTIRAWRHPLTVPAYLVFALATGASLLMPIAWFFGRFQTAQAVIAGLALIAAAIVKFFYWRSIDAGPRTYTMASATGLGPGVRQWEVPHTSTNFIMKEMGYAVARKHALKLRLIVFVLLIAALAAAALSLLVNPAIFLFATPFSLAAAAVERWLFFAEAQHVSSLYYGAERA